MTRWIREEARRRTYFARIQWAIEEFGQDGIDPPDECIEAVIAIGITNDDSFESLIFEKSEANPDLRKLREVCAKAFHQDYIRAVEDGSWPET
jgi:hypothetical protein